MNLFQNRPVPGKHIILFDGVCGLCDRLCQFVLAKDKGGKFMFASLQSSFGKEMLSTYNRNVEELSTFYVIAQYGTKKERLLSQSDAAIFVLVELGGLLKPAALLMILPVHLRDSVYRLIAKYRYRIFGKYDQCLVPDQNHAKRFIEL